MLDFVGEQEIIRDTKEEIISELYKLYGTDYEFIRSYEVPKKGLIGFITNKKQLCVKYRVKAQGSRGNSGMAVNAEEETPVANMDFLRRQAESQERDEEEFRMEQNRQAILASQTSVLVNAQMAQFQSSLDSLAEKLDSRLQVSSSDKHATIARIEEILAENEFSFSYISRMTDKIRKTFSLEQMEDFDLVERTVVDWIGESICGEEEKHVRPPMVQVIVGPTGVGKTTTLVKLAAAKIVEYKKQDRTFDLRLITTDYTRVGAKEQLEHFGEILHREVIKAETMDDLKEIYDQNKNRCDGIFIDTGGYSPNDSTNIAKLKNILTVPGLTPQIFLAFDAKTKCSDIKNIMNNYEPFGYTSVVVTKCDESTRFGNIISALNEKNKKVAFVTYGQSPAKNISRGNPLFFLEKLNGFNLDMDHLKQKFSVSEDY